MQVTLWETLHHMTKASCISICFMEQLCPARYVSVLCAIFFFVLRSPHFPRSWFVARLLQHSNPLHSSFTAERIMTCHYTITMWYVIIFLHFRLVLLFHIFLKKLYDYTNQFCIHKGNESDFHSQNTYYQAHIEGKGQQGHLLQAPGLKESQIFS
jgi:hypothetical protein